MLVIKTETGETYTESYDNAGDLHGSSRFVPRFPARFIARADALTVPDTDRIVRSSVRRA